MAPPRDSRLQVRRSRQIEKIRKVRRIVENRDNAGSSQGPDLTNDERVQCERMYANVVKTISGDTMANLMVVAADMEIAKLARRQFIEMEEKVKRTLHKLADEVANDRLKSFKARWNMEIPEELDDENTGDTTQISTQDD